MPNTAQLERLSRLQHFLEHDPDNLNLLADVADLALSCKALDVSRSAVMRALELAPDNPYFALRMSSIALTEGNIKEALSMTEQLLQAGHDDAGIYYNHAHALLACGQYAAARDVLLVLSKNEQPLPAVTEMLVRSLHYLGELEEAIQVALAHLEKYPDDTEVAGMLSLLYFDMDDLAAAAKWSQRALGGTTKYSDALITAGGIALSQEDSAKTKTLMEQAVGIDPQNGRIWVNLGLANLLELKLDAALDNFNDAVKYMPDHIGSWHVLGWTQLLLNDLDGAQHSFEIALNTDDNFGETYGGLAAVAASRNEWEKADEYVKKARRLDSEGISTHYVEILRAQRKGQGVAALNLLEATLKQGVAPGGGNLLNMIERTVKRHKK